MSLQPSLFDAIPTTTIIHPIRLVRTTDPDTSHKAAQNASRRGPSQRTRIWEALKRLGEATDYELSIEVVLLEPFATHRNGEDVVHLLCRLCAAFAFDLALVVVAL